MKRVVQFFSITFIVLFSLSCEDPIDFIRGIIDDLAVEENVESKGGSSGSSESESGSSGGVPPYRVSVRIEALDPFYNYQGISIWLPKTSTGPHPDAGKNVLSGAKIYESTYDSSGPDTTYKGKKAWRLYTSDTVATMAGLSGTPNGKLKLTLKVTSRAAWRTVINTTEIVRQGAVVNFDTME